MADPTTPKYMYSESYVDPLIEKNREARALLKECEPKFSWVGLDGDLRKRIHDCLAGDDDDEQH